MSILKGILHHWNKTNKNYDTIHPETESAQITDWHSGIMSSLASKTLGTVVDAITTDSVLGKLIKMLLNASGVKYLIDTNGYICFGEYFGGLIIQWGLVNSNVEFAYPIAFNTACLAIAPTLIQDQDDWRFIGRGIAGNARATIYTHYSNGTLNTTQVGYIAVGE